MWVFTLACLDATDTAKTLYFSDGFYIDSGKNQYLKRIVTPALVNVSPNDGGVFSIFDSASVGDIELENKDGGLDYLPTYAIDGRAAVLSWVDENGSATEYYRGVATKIAESNDRITISLKAPHEVLNDNFPMSVYAGTNTGFTGLEGTDDDIKDNYKPQVFGDCRNVSAILVNASLLIYQASSLLDCIITAVYDDGVRLVNYRVNGAHSIADTTIAIDGGLGDIPAGSEVMFSNHSTIYSVATGLTGGEIILSSGLTANIPDNTILEVVNFYANTIALQATDYQASGSHAAGATTIALYSGVGAITTGQQVSFSNQQAVYTVATGLTGGEIILSSGLILALNGDEFVFVVDDEPTLWGSYQGYFTVMSPPLGTITCDCLSITSGVVHSAGDVFESVATAAGLTVDSGSVTELNTAGNLGLYIDNQVTTGELLDKIVKSLGAYYYIAANTLYAQLLQQPSTPSFTIEDQQIKSITRVATGLGANSLPIKAIHALYDRIETVQDTLAGGVNASWRERLKSQYREITSTDSSTATRHPTALTLEIESLLRKKSDINAVKTRLLNLVKSRRDVVLIDAVFDQLPSFTLGDTIEVITQSLGYGSGRDLVIIGYKVDAKRKLLSLRCFG